MLWQPFKEHYTEGSRWTELSVAYIHECDRGLYLWFSFLRPRSKGDKNHRGVFRMEELAFFPFNVITSNCCEGVSTFLMHLYLPYLFENDNEPFRCEIGKSLKGGSTNFGSSSFQSPSQRCQIVQRMTASGAMVYLNSINQHHYYLLYWLCEIKISDLLASPFPHLTTPQPRCWETFQHKGIAIPSADPAIKIADHS